MKQENKRKSFIRFGKKGGVLFSFGVILLIITTVVGISSRGEPSDAPVSMALNVIAEKNSMAMAGLCGQSIEFEKDDFLRCLNLSHIDSITITEAPPISDGELRLASTVLKGGEEISAASLSKLAYFPSSDIRESEFTFRPSGASYLMTCKLYMLESPNLCPTLSVASELSLNVSTYKNIKLYGNLPVHDPEGDEVRIEIVSYPKSGTVELSDSAVGDYVFTPAENFSGKDSFTYVARDKYGNYSASATVSLTVKKPSSSITYTDMNDSPAYSAALSVTEAGVMSGSEVGGNSYFYPNRTVSRGEFTVMALHAAGISEGIGSSYTVFSDCDLIPEEMREYISTAYDLGYIKGVNVDGKLCFQPDRAITVAEAAVLLGNILDAPTPTVTPTFSDSGDIPAWAASSVYSLCGIGVIPTSSGDDLSPNEPLTRAEAAVFLSNLMSELER